METISILNRESICYNTRAKDQSPERTIKLIRNILSEAGIVTIESWSNPSKGCYWVNLRIANTSLFTNGKGTTEVYALASAYGELMERLQNLVIFRFSIGYPTYSNPQNKNIFFSDEKMLSIDKFFQQNNSLSDFFSNEEVKIEAKIEEMKRWLHIQNSQFSFSGSDEYDGLICIPFLNIKTLESCYVPAVPMDIMFATNGMCAGNTPAEALVQGFSEIFERHVNLNILTNKITPPDIPKEILKKYFKSYALIQEIEKNTNLKIVVKDCSLGKGYPVIGIIFIDQSKNSYFIKFGAHPIADIALERCITELFQGRTTKNLNWMKKCTFHYPIDLNKQNMTEIIKNGDGIYPFQLFAEKPTYQYTDIHLKLKVDSNKEILNQMMDLIINEGYDIYVRDWSYLGFPAYQIIIPHMSNIYNSNKERLDWQESYCKARAAVLNLTKVGTGSYEAINDFMKSNNYSNNQGISTILDLPFYLDNPVNNLKRDIFLALYAIKEGRYSEAYYYFDNYIKFNNSNVSTSMECMRACLGLLSEKVTDQNEISRYLYMFYSKSMVEGIIKIVFNAEDIFNSYETSCPNCNICKVKSYCYIVENKKVYDRLKHISIENNLTQDKLIKFIKKVRE